MNSNEKNDAHSFSSKYEIEKTGPCWKVIDAKTGKRIGTVVFQTKKRAEEFMNALEG